jgi:hypothetical protein
MEIDRRSLLTGTACAVLTGITARAGPPRGEFLASETSRWHELTQSLLDRARRAGPSPEAIDHPTIERAVRSVARATGRDGPLVIKWLADPAEAVGYLSRFGLDELLRMGTTNFWYVPVSGKPFDRAAFERAFDVRCPSAEILCVEENDRALMGPKLAAKSAAMANGASKEELFVVRARMAQIGWLETSWAASAANAIFEVEFALHAGESEDCQLIGHQLRVFEAYEAGLLATWETPAAILCVPRPIAV